MSQVDRLLTAFHGQQWPNGRTAMDYVAGGPADEPLELFLVEVDSLIAVYACNEVAGSGYVAGVPPFQTRDITENVTVHPGEPNTLTVDIDTTGLKLRVSYWNVDISP